MSPENQEQGNYEDMCAKHEQTECAMDSENKKSLHWMELAIEDPLFEVRYTRLFGANLYAVDIVQKPPLKEGVRNIDFEIVYPLYTVY